MPTLAQVINKINSDITTNGNEEITGVVLNSVLLDIVAQINDLTGKLEDLNTDDVSSIVNSINSLKQELDDYINSQVGTLSGVDDPNETDPIGFDGRVGTIYLKMATIGAETIPESYWIYTGVNDVDWLNLTADDVFKMVVVDHYSDLPAQGQTNRIYFVQDENNTYIWNVNIFPNDYVLVGGVVEGEFIDDTTFNDEFGNPVTPNTGNLYLDTVTGKYYRWDGNYFLPIDQDTGGSGTPNFAYLNDQQYVKYSEATGRLESGKITETPAGIDVNGNIKAQAVELENETGTPANNTITRNGNQLKHTDETGAIRNIATDVQVYKTISGNVTLDDTYHNAICWITANAIITVPSTLRADFNCVFDVRGNFTGTFTEGSGVIFSAPFGNLLKNNSMCSLSKYTSTNYRLNGGLLPV